VVVPVTALRRGPSGDFVYVINDDRTVTMRPVERGVATNDVIAVTKGLEVGERVVTEGGRRLRDRARGPRTGDRPPARRRGRAAAERPAGVGRGGRIGQPARRVERGRGRVGRPAPPPAA